MYLQRQRGRSGFRGRGRSRGQGRRGMRMPSRFPSQSRSRNRRRSMSHSLSRSRSRSPPSRSSESSGSDDHLVFLDSGILAGASAVSSTSHQFGSTPHSKAVDLIKKMGYENRPKTSIKLKNALKPLLTAIAYTPLDVVLSTLKKNHPDLVDTQFAVALEHVAVKRLSDIEKEVIDVALSESRKISKVCPVQIVPSWSIEAQPAITELKEWAKDQEKAQIMDNTSTLVKKSVTVGSADPIHVILHGLVKCGYVAADDQYQHFQVSTCDPVTQEWLKKLPRNYAKTCKRKTREFMQGLLNVNDLVSMQSSPSVRGYIPTDSLTQSPRPECVPSLLHLLSITKKAPNKVFKRDEILAAIADHATVVYATSPALVMGIKVKEAKGPSFKKQQKSPSQRPKVESFDPLIKVTCSKTPQFVSLRYKELFPSARSRQCFEQGKKVKHDQNITHDQNFKHICETQVKYLSQKRSAPVMVGREDYEKQHADKLAVFLRSKASLENRVQVAGCEMVLTGMSRAEFLRTAMRCCISVEQLSAADVVCSLQVNRQIDVGENGLIQYWF